MSGFIDCFGTTDIGRRRPSNEDQFLISDVCKSMRVHQTSLALDHHTRLFRETQGTLLLVADGMGGHEAGERASQLAIDGLVEYVLNRLSWFMSSAVMSSGAESEHDFEEQLKSALLSCQHKIDREVAAIPQRRGMGSTLTMAYVIWPKMFLVHVGDSRCYLLRGGHLQQLTRDHTLATLTSRNNGHPNEETEDSDDDTPEPHPFANVLWNVLGGDGGEPHPDASAVELAIGDVLLLCTDGLTNHIGHRKLREMLSVDQSTANTCKQLIDEANAGGGNDNITAVVCRFVEKEPSRQMEQEVELPLESSLHDTVDFEEKPLHA